MPEALRWSGEEKSAEEVAMAIEADEVVYRTSGGGVTFSGGEPLEQAEFVYEIASICRRKGIHTAIETSGYAEQGKIAALIPLIDLWLFDVKHPDNEKHRYYTGVDNEPIIANLRYLSRLGVPVVVRIPFIGGVNADQETVAETIELLRSIGGVREVHLLPYHELGVGKYGQLGRTYRAPGYSVTAEDVDEALEKFRAAGFVARNDGIKPRPRQAD
jgi:pyruvate formate lyase activating enzyme